MREIDLNADTGEADTLEWMAIEAAIMTQISSANIACGGHAGTDETMARTVALASRHNVNIGAHPAYPDRKNFGRKSLKLGKDISASVLQNSITAQITRLCEIAADQGRAVTYVKPHGALYNDAVFDLESAHLIVQTLIGIDPALWLMGAPDSCLTQAAKEHGLTFIAEGFVDRRYTDTGHLQSRKESGAVIELQNEREAQALALLGKTPVTTATGQKLRLDVDTLCLHSDSPGADITAKQIRRDLEAKGARIKAFHYAA